MNKKKRFFMLCLCLAVLNIAFIWGNSLLPREVSSAFSKMVGAVLDWFLPGPVTTSQGTGQGILRKIAHFLEFCSLGFLFCVMTCLQNRKMWMRCVLPCSMGVAVAAIDETIQIFAPERGPQLRDVGIDSLGVILGVGVAILAAWIWNQYMKKYSHVRE